MLVFAAPKKRPGELIRFECADDLEREEIIDELSSSEKVELYWASYTEKKVSEKYIDQCREDFKRYLEFARKRDAEGK